MKTILVLSALVVLTACSGNRSSINNTGSTRGATGDISRACLIADRERATPALCGCVQRVANAELSTRDRARVARFFSDPEIANDAKISDTTADDAFWARYRDFTRSASNQCG